MQYSPDSHGVVLRPIEMRDQKAMARLIRSVFEEYEAPMTGTVYDDPRTWHIFETITNQNAGYWVLIQDDIVAGGCGFYPTEGLPSGYAELVKFYLSPIIRGKGYGTKLFLHVIEQARKSGYKNLYIESFPEFNAAVSMYRRNGFKEIPERLGNSGHTSTTIHMAKEL
ncbi:MAG: GNAT family N-acetyltransferase [Bacteroidales bacterium]|nr:GNAT family N-acetyltransferase [Bacteroidales bacterium]